MTSRGVELPSTRRRVCEALRAGQVKECYFWAHLPILLVTFEVKSHMGQGHIEKKSGGGGDYLFTALFISLSSI